MFIFAVVKLVFTQYQPEENPVQWQCSHKCGQAAFARFPQGAKYLLLVEHLKKLNVLAFAKCRLLHLSFIGEDGY